MSDFSSRFTARRPTLDDAEGILAVGIARDIADVGYPDYSLDDVREELTEPGLDLERDAWVVCDGDGRVVASALITGGDARVAVHPEVCGAGAGTYLRTQVEGRAREGGEAVIRQVVSGSNDPARRLLEAAGYRAVQHYWRMARALDSDEQALPWPTGLDVRPYELGADDAAAHALVQDAFTDIPGTVSRGFDEWRAMTVGGAQFAPDLSTAALDSEALAGVALCERWEDGQGYVAYLAVARDWRGRGLGRALLAASLANMRTAGLAKAALSVNGRNESATHLYTSAGMRVDSRAERYDKSLG